MTKLQRLVAVIRAGRIDYNSGLQLQKLVSNQPTKAEDFHNVLILLEHYPVYTIGIRTKGYTDQDEIKLRKLGAEFFRTDRGGLITFHGLGQLVAYPVLNLKQFKPSMRWYVGALEQTVLDTCHQFGLNNVSTTKDTGIWVGEKKICAIGVHGSRYVTTHGIGLNCNTDLSWFDHIVPCGIDGKGVTSLSAELKRDIKIGEASEVFINSFKKVFNCDIVECSNVNEVLNKCQRENLYLNPSQARRDL